MRRGHAAVGIREKPKKTVGMSEHHDYGVAHKRYRVEARVEPQAPPQTLAHKRLSDPPIAAASPAKGLLRHVGSIVRGGWSGG